MMETDLESARSNTRWESIFEKLGIDKDGIKARTTKRFFRNRIAVIAMFILVCLYLMAIFAPLIAPYDPLETNYTDRFEPPSSEYIMGTDFVGRDIFSRVVHGARISLSIGLVSAAISYIVGVPLGLISGYYGGWPDEIIQRMTEFFQSIPTFFLMLAMVAVWGGYVERLWLIVIITGVMGWTGPCRMLRGQVLQVKENEYIESAKAIGCSARRIMFHHILPNSIFVTIVQVTLRSASALLMASGLSFLGLGIQPPSPEWGAILNQGRGHIIDAWWIMLFPGLFIFITVLCFNFLGDGLRDAIDPRQEIDDIEVLKG